MAASNHPILWIILFAWTLFAQLQAPAIPTNLRLVSTTETAHAYFAYQMASREFCASDNSGINCKVRIVGRNKAPNVCAAADPAGGCSLRNDAQIQALDDNTTRSPRAVYFLGVGRDDSPNPQDAARTWYPGEGNPVMAANGGLGAIDMPADDQLYFRFGAGIGGSVGPAAGGTLTMIYDDFLGKEWLPNRCGGAVGFGSPSMGGYHQKSYRLEISMGDRRSLINPKRFQTYTGATQANDATCTQNTVAHTTGGGSGGGGIYTTGTTSNLVSPSVIGVDIHDNWFVAPGRNAFTDPSWTKTPRTHPQKGATWTRHVYHLEWNVPANSTQFNDWRADCDPTGVNTPLDQECANMLTVIAAVDPDCATVGAPNCDSIWALLSYWVCDETRGCQRINYRVPVHNAAGLYWRLEENAGGAGCTSCGNRYVYHRNFMFIRNITASDIDDTGCSSACIGDQGVVSRNVFRKPVQ